MDERAVQAVHGAVLALVVGTGDAHLAAFYLNVDVGVDILGELAFGAFDGHGVAFDGNGGAGRYGDGEVTYS